MALSMLPALIIAILLVACGCHSVVDVDRFRASVQRAIHMDSIDPATSVAGLPVDSVYTLRTHQRVIVFYTDSTLQRIEGGFCEVNADSSRCDTSCRAKIDSTIQSKLGQQAPLRFWRASTLAQVRASKQNDLQIVLDIGNGHRSIPFWRVESIFRYEVIRSHRSGDVSIASMSWWLLFVLGLAIGFTVTVEILRDR